MAKTGPKEKQVDWNTVAELCHIHCTMDEISSVIGYDLKTIEARCLEDNKLKFSEFYRQKRDGGKMSLRRMQYTSAQTNPSLLIWLGKSWLGQRDKPEDETEDSKQVTINFNVVN
jgi:hypothetical protein